jgi:Lhr-like helicase
MLASTRTVIVDEIHALAPNSRGAHLALSLERLEALWRATADAHRLSATQKTDFGSRQIPRRRGRKWPSSRRKPGSSSWP